MKKQAYMKPAMRVVEMKHRCNILAGSGNEPTSYSINSNLAGDAAFDETIEGGSGYGR